jgi:hypothetical protein
MSKSRGNVVNPDDIVREYGADALRLYEMFMGPLEAVKLWQTSQIQGVSGFGPLWLSLGATSWVTPGWMLNRKCLTHLKGLPARAVAPGHVTRSMFDQELFGYLLLKCRHIASYFGRSRAVS